MKKLILFVISSFVVLLVVSVANLHSAQSDELEGKVDTLFIKACGGLEKYRDLAEPSKKALIGMGRDAVPYLLGKLSSQDAREMWTLIEILGKIGEPAVVPLIDSLKSENKDVVKLSSRILGDIKDKRAVTPLIGLLDKKDFNTRSYACESLGKIGDTTAFTSVSFCLKDSVEVVRKSAAVALGKLKDKRAVSYLIRSLSDPHFSVRMTSASALVEIRKPSVGPLIKLLNTHKADTIAVYLAIESLGKLKNKKATSTLVKKLGSKDWATRAFTVEALWKISGKKGIGAIRKLKKKEHHPFVKMKIEEVLAKKAK
jgi:HEAT repeat protein